MLFMAKKYRPKKCFSKKYRFSQFPNFPKFPTKILSQKHTQKFEFQNEERLQNQQVSKCVVLDWEECSIK